MDAPDRGGRGDGPRPCRLQQRRRRRWNDRGDRRHGTTGTTGGAGGTTITAEGFAFNPATLQVPSGETTLTITNNDGATHTFTLDDGSADQEVPAGESIEVTVNITASTGFHCKIHPSMTGTLEVA